MTHWAEQYLNIPFVDRGRTREGLDCYGLVRLIYQEQLAIQTPDYTEHYTSVADVEEIAALLAREIGTRWRPIATRDARRFDGLIFRIKGQPTHFAIVLDPPKFLHILPDTRVSIERWDSILWQKRLVSAVRWNERTDRLVTHVSRETPPILAPTGNFRLIACPSLSHERRIDRHMEPGGTVLSHMHRLGWFTVGLHARVHIDGRYIPEAEWGFAEPQAGQNLVMRVIPRGGGAGGGGGKEVLRIVGMLALVVGAFFTAGGGLGAFLPEALAMGLSAGTTAATVAAGAVFLAGSLALNALIPPAQPQLENLSGRGNSSGTLSLTGSSNQMAPYARIPRVYGTHRIFPPLAARPYTEVVGNNQFLRLLFCFGYGPLTLADIKIGETPIEQFQGVEMEIRYGYDSDPPLTLAPDDVLEDNLSILLRAGVWQGRTSQANAKELSIDLSFPTGIARLNGTGGLIEHTVQFSLEYRKSGDVAWIGVNNTPAVTATLTTSFTGNNNDLVFTAKAIGAAGNIHTVVFQHGPALSITKETSTDGRGGTFPSNTFLIKVISGTTTAAQVKAAIEAHPQANAAFTITHAPGNNGTGAINVAFTFLGDRFTVQEQQFHMAGGRDAIPSLSISGRSTAPLRHSVRWIVNQPGEAFDVQIKRLTAEGDPNVFRDEAYWTTIRTIQTSSPVQKRNMCMMALRIRATNQLNGTVDTLNAVATSVLMDWDKDEEEWILQPTGNAASIYRDILQGLANNKPKPDTMVDFPILQDFHERSEADGFSFNAVIDFQTTPRELRQNVLAAARGAFGMRDMKYSVIQDLQQDIPANVITPRNSSSFRWTRRFVEMPHAFKCRFVDASNDWKQGEVIVYADGYNESNATIFEEVEAGLGVTSAGQVWKMKRRELAEGLLRPDDYEVQVDFEHITYTRGDRVLCQHPVIRAGLKSARIKSVSLNGGGAATGIVVDDYFVMGLGLTYGVRIRLADGTQIIHPLVNTPGEINTVTFGEPFTEHIPAAGDLAMFGELGSETIDCIVKGIEPGPDYTATVHLLDYAPGIQVADAGDIPPYNPQISLPAAVLTPIPTIVQVQSDESVLVRDIDGALQSRILVTLHFPSGFRLPVTRIEAQYRVAGSQTEWSQLFAPVSGTSADIAIAPVEDGLAYDVQLRTVDDNRGQVSEWAMVSAHTVVGKNTPPPDVPALVLEGIRLRWSYANPPRDLAGFLVRSRPGTSVLWDGAIPAHDNTLQTTDFEIFQREGIQTFLVKAVDVAGNVSVNPVTLTVAFAGIQTANILETIDHRDLEWPGNVTNGSRAGDLVAEISSPFWTDDSALFWNDDAALMWDLGFKELVYDFTVDIPDDMTDGALTIQIEMQGNWAILYLPDTTPPMWTDDGEPFWTDDDELMWENPGTYVQWPGRLEDLHQTHYQFRVIGYAGLVQAIIEELLVTIDVPDIEESLHDIAIAGAGTRLPITKTYREIVSVSVTVVDDAGAAAYPKIMDKNAALGPLTKVFDSSDLATTGVVDARIRGY